LGSELWVKIKKPWGKGGGENGSHNSWDGGQRGVPKRFEKGEKMSINGAKKPPKWHDICGKR